MKVLFDNGTPKPIARSLIGHEVTFARQIGSHELKNGELLRQAEEARFVVFLTWDKNIRYQQNLTERSIAIVVLGNQQWPRVKLCVGRIASATDCAAPGTFTEVEIPTPEE